MDHFKNNFRDRVMLDYERQMVKWGNANKDIMVAATEAQANWRRVLEAARLRKKAEEEREKMIMSLVLGMMTGVAFGFIGSAVSAKIGQSMGRKLTENVTIEEDIGALGLKIANQVKLTRSDYDSRLGQLFGSAIEQFEDKGGIDVVQQLSSGKPDYFSALNHMHSDFVTMERLRRDLEKGWQSTVIKGKEYLHYLNMRATEEWCDRMFLQPAHGNLDKAKSHCEEFLVRLTNSLREKTKLWGHNPRIGRHIRDEIEREIWAIYVLVKQQKKHFQGVDNSGMPHMRGAGHRADGRDIAWTTRPMPPWFGEQKSAMMVGMDKEVTMRLAHLGVAVPQTPEQLTSLGRRGMKEGRVDIDEAVDTPAEYKALRQWAKSYIGTNKDLAPKADAIARGRISRLSQLDMTF
ncbi:MAG: hypothetical protein AAGG45_04040 [Pseudomonadota bacterium]